MLFELSNPNSNLVLTLGYLNPALNNSAPGITVTSQEKSKTMVMPLHYTWGLRINV